MLKKLLIAAVVLAAPVAYAQGEQPELPADQHQGGVENEHGHGAPESAHSAEHESAQNEAGAPGGEEHVDMTRHYNFFGYESGSLFDYKKKDAFGGPLGDGVMVDKETGETIHEEEPGSPPFVLMLLNFGILLFILGKYGWPVASKLARDRHDQIKTALDEAAKLRAEAQKKLSEYEDRIKGLDSEVKKLVDDIRAAAESDKARILENASRQAAQMKKDAEARIAAEIDIARATLAREVAVATATATEKLLREKVTQDDQTKLVGTFITNMSTTPTKEAR